MKKLIFVVALALAGCASEGEKAEEEYRLAAKHAVDHKELCEPAQRAADAYLRAGDEKRYEHWKLMVSVHCI
jgi:uncharacterized lipoprotein YmbA